MVHTRCAMSIILQHHKIQNQNSEVETKLLRRGANKVFLPAPSLEHLTSGERHGGKRHEHNRTVAAGTGVAHEAMKAPATVPVPKAGGGDEGNLPCSRDAGLAPDPTFVPAKSSRRHLW